MKLLICTQIVDQHDPVLGFFHEWIATFASHIEAVHVICLKEGAHTLPGNVFVHSLGKERGASRIRYIRLLYRYLWQYRREYDAVFVHMNPEYVILGGVFWRMLRKRIVLWYAHGAVNLRLKVAALLAHAVATASPESYRLASKKIVVGHGIARATCTAAPWHEPLRLVTVGRISPIKGYEIMFDTMTLLKDRGIESELTVIGAPATDADHRYETSIQKEASEQSLRVSWKGGLPHTAVLSSLCEADIFLNCSETGSLDKAALEAMGAGLPLVTSNKGLTSMLADVDQDALVDRSAQAFADRIAALRARPAEELRLLTERYRTFVHDRYSLPALIERIVNILAT